jgi:ferritin-like metal-binding protein YciE
MLSNPRDLFLRLLGEQLWTERTLAFEVLPKLRCAVESEGLAAALAQQLEQTREQAARLERVFRAADAEPSSNLSPPAERLASHHDEVAQQIANERLADVFHAAAAATTEHHELAAYDALLELAAALELPDDAREALEQNRREEAEALERVESELRRLVGEL